LIVDITLRCDEPNGGIRNGEPREHDRSRETHTPAWRHGHRITPRRTVLIPRRVMKTSLHLTKHCHIRKINNPGYLQLRSINSKQSPKYGIYRASTGKKDVFKRRVFGVKLNYR